MNELVLLYAGFSIAALLAKAIIAWYGREELRNGHRWLLVFFISLCGINALELTGFFYPSNGRYAVVLITAYYGWALLMGVSFLGCSMVVTEHSNRWHPWLALFALGGNVLLFWPGAVIAGVDSLGYTSTRIPGPMYWFFQVSLVGLLSLGIALLGYHAKFGSTLTLRRRAKALLISMLPIIFVAFAVVVMMQIGVKVTASVFGSCAILAFLMIFIRTSDEHQLFRFLSQVPATSEFNFVSRIRDAVYRTEEATLQDTISRFESAIIQETLSKTGGNKTAAAELLGISRTSLRRKLQSTVSLERG